jgi:hypothetical protein
VGGSLVIVLSLSEVKNLHIWAHDNAPVTYLAGLLWFVAGLAVVRVHNHWRLGWALLITLSGWLALCIGLFRAFFPEAQRGMQDVAAVAVYGIDGVLFASRLCLTAAAFGKRSE